MVRSGAGVIANVSVQLNQQEKTNAKFSLSRVLLNDIHLLRSSMKKNTPVEQLTNKMEELDVEQQQLDEDLDEETLAMKAMGLPISFTSSLVNRREKEIEIQMNLFLDRTIETFTSNTFRFIK